MDLMDIGGLRVSKQRSSSEQYYDSTRQKEDQNQNY